MDTFAVLVNFADTTARLWSDLRKLQVIDGEHAISRHSHRHPNQSWLASACSFSLAAGHGKGSTAMAQDYDTHP